MLYFVGIVTLIMIVVLIEGYTYLLIEKLFNTGRLFFRIFFFLSSLAFLFFVKGLVSIDMTQSTNPKVAGLTFLLLLCYGPKVIIAIVLLLEDFWLELSFLTTVMIAGDSNKLEIEKRHKSVSVFTLTLGLIAFFGIIYGNTMGRYNFKVENKTFFFPSLPSEFDGYRIVHVSDLQLGSFFDQEKLGEALALIAVQKTDLLLITGDMVSENAREIKPWISTFRNMQVKDGKYAVRGYRDIGYIYNWSSLKQKNENHRNYEENMLKCGINVLDDASLLIKRAGSKMVLIGVQPKQAFPFTDIGGLLKATEGLKSEEFSILMSHSPFLFGEELQGLNKNIDLTLSGFTHGGSYGFTLFGEKFSLASFFYTYWAGEYNENGQKLYVNRGLGTSFLPGRVGMWPEITVITLRKGLGH